MEITDEQFDQRRIKRSIYIDISTIGFCSPNMIENLKMIHYLKEYIIKTEDEIESYNNKNNIDTQIAVNGRRLTNVGTFRVYIEEYIKHNPNIHKGLSIMVRQLEMGEKGLPIEIYAFTNDINWSNYEKIQADIFDHILAVAEEFGLKVFQNPSGHDIRQITKA